jgi:transposase
MDVNKYSTQIERLEVVETCRRRRWSDDEKFRIVLESLRVPRAISSTARRYGISRSLLMQWHKLFCPAQSANRAQQTHAPAPPAPRSRSSGSLAADDPILQVNVAEQLARSIVAAAHAISPNLVGANESRSPVDGERLFQHPASDGKAPSRPRLCNRRRSKYHPPSRSLNGTDGNRADDHDKYRRAFERYL